MPSSGDEVRVRLHSGGTLEGIVNSPKVWERRDVSKGWLDASRDERESGLRLWYIHELDGFQWVPTKEIVEIRILGSITDADRREMAKRREVAARRSEEERKRQEREKAKLEDAGSIAKSLIAEVEKAKKEADEAAAKEAKKKDGASGRTKRLAELLAKFPPEKWSLDTPKEIEKRKLVLHLFPSEDELDFLKVYDEWKVAFAAWKTAQNIEADGDKGAPKAAPKDDAKTSAKAPSK